MNSSDAISRDMNSLLFSSTLKHSSESEFAKIKQLLSSDHPPPDYHHQSSFQQPSPPPPPQSSLLRYRSAPIPNSVIADLVHETNNRDDVDGFNDSLNSPVPSDRLFSDGSRQLSTNMNLEGSYSVESSATSSNLIRQSSSPAGFFSSLNDGNGTAVVRNVRTPSSSSKLNNHNNIPSGPSTSRFMPQISEDRHETIGIGNYENGHLVNSNVTNRSYDPSTRSDCWNNSSFKSLKRDMNGEVKMYAGLNGFEIQNGDSNGYTPNLVHQLSLPKTSSEMAAIGKFLHFEQESVPCKTRAKRGHATHPRSIAERVRRNRISDRMKNLQELFPGMDKQANTAEMLDMAVEFIKDLEKEVQTLTETRARCTCLRAKKLSPTE